MNSTLGKTQTSPLTQSQRRNAREEFLRKKLNFSLVSSSALDSPADISPSTTTVAASDATSMSAIASTPAQEVAPLLSPPVEKEAKSEQVQGEFLLKSVEASPPRRSYSHVTVAKEPPQMQFGPRNGLRPNWGRRTKKA